MATKSAKKASPAKKMNITPLGDNVLVQRVEAESTTAGGIVLPESAKEKPREGKVIAVGEGRVNDDGVRTKPQVSKKLRKRLKKRKKKAKLSALKRVFGKKRGFPTVKLNGTEFVLHKPERARMPTAAQKKKAAAETTIAEKSGGCWNELP